MQPEVLPRKVAQTRNTYRMSKLGHASGTNRGGSLTYSTWTKPNSQYRPMDIVMRGSAFIRDHQNYRLGWGWESKITIPIEQRHF